MKKHCEHLIGRNRPEYFLMNSQINEGKPDIHMRMTVEEVRTVLSKMKNGRS